MVSIHIHVHISYHTCHITKAALFLYGTCNKISQMLNTRQNLPKYVYTILFYHVNFRSQLELGKEKRCIITKGLKFGTPTIFTLTVQKLEHFGFLIK